MSETKPAYLVASSIMPSDHGSLEAYAAAAHPLFEKYGVEVIAMGNVGSFGSPEHVVHEFEGDWPEDASLTIFRFPSMKALLEFWNSEQYQAVKHLRTDVIAPNFTVAIDGA